MKGREGGKGIKIEKGREGYRKEAIEGNEEKNPGRCLSIAP